MSQPGVVLPGPPLTAVIDDPVAQQQLRQPVPSPRQIAATVLAGPNQVPGGLPVGRPVPAKFVPADLIPAAERPDAEYPMVLITGRQLEHWHTGAMTRRAGVLDAIEPEPTASLNPADLRQLKAQPGDLITVESRRGRISLFAREDAGTPVGSVFIPFAFYEAAANILTNPVLDPFGKIPEFKYCAVKVTKGGASPVDPGYGKGRSLSQLQS